MGYVSFDYALPLRPTMVNQEDFSGTTFRFRAFKYIDKKDEVLIYIPAEAALQSLFLRETLDEHAIKREDIEEENPETIIPTLRKYTFETVSIAYEYCKYHENDKFWICRIKKYRALTEQDIQLFSTIDDDELRRVRSYAEWMDIPNLYNSLVTFVINHLRKKPKQTIANILGIKNFNHHKGKEALVKFQFQYCAPL